MQTVSDRRKNNIENLTIRLIKKESQPEQYNQLPFIGYTDFKDFCYHGMSDSLKP